ncbi:class I SAM-dependent methyltransferase [Streptomyces sp. HU2014]|uniref:class I SAM-dependent methyltransferase n=1 Tax=Streptomyces sp. HU2014 TaxID=2939414 RepID=UPI00200E96F8|nr:class I SAM-dependent methyltransferase [Streptomyces sp. HU2014]UQI46149.1 class I SAM-dependent methyltransferase [Streptomyces sp. HU2014]
MRWWLREPGAVAPADLRALDVIEEGPVLDIGCSTGRHLERLMARGIDAEGIDLLEAAVEQAVRHGCRVRLADLWTFHPSRAYRHLLLMGNNIGLAGRLSRLPALLDRLAGLLAPGGSVLVSGKDQRGGPDLPGRADWTASGERPYPGDRRIRHLYAGQTGPWFPWLDVDPDTLAARAADRGFETHVEADADGRFLATLRLRPRT